MSQSAFNSQPSRGAAMFERFRLRRWVWNFRATEEPLQFIEPRLTSVAAYGDDEEANQPQYAGVTGTTSIQVA